MRLILMGYSNLPVTEKGVTIDNKLLTVFITVSAFLGGLIMPSPITRK
jgi:hypothetical protein